MPWSDLFSCFDTSGTCPDARARLEPVALMNEGPAESVVAAVVTGEITAHLREILAMGAGRMAREHPDTQCRIYLKAATAAMAQDLADIGFAVLHYGESEVPVELLPLLALGEKRCGGTTFTGIERFWHAAEDVSRTKLLPGSGAASWRVLDTWSARPEDYCAVRNDGWGCLVSMELEPLLGSFFANRGDGTSDHRRQLARQFMTQALYPRLLPGGILSLLPEVSAPARHWVALDIETATRSNPASEILMLPPLKDENDLRELPTVRFKGYEIPVAGVYSSHQRLSIFSPELEKLHAGMREILRDFHTFAGEMNLRYSLWAGSLLGLFTCGDFLPWDDDIDILVHPDDFQRLEAFWQNCPHASSDHIPYHRRYTRGLNRVARIGRNDYEFLSSEPGQERILYKLRPLESEGIFAYNIGGLDLTTIRYEEGQWLERWKLDQKIPPAAALDQDVEDVFFGGVATRAYRRDLIEPFLLEKYHPLEWWRHPSLAGK